MRLFLVLWVLPLFAEPTEDDAATIMAKVAANVEKAVDARRTYVYRQTVRGSLVRSDGPVSRREKREYSVIPTEKGTEKKLLSLDGEYRKGKRMFPYTEAGFKYKDTDIDAELIDNLVDSLVNDKDSRDGIPHSLFPLRSKDLSAYRFTMKGQREHAGRGVYEITFEPVTNGNGDDCSGAPWKGEAWIDVKELQPVRIATDLAFKIPWAVRAFLGTNLRQTGFAITYARVAENIWFPATYGTEFRVDLLWFYKRTIALSLESMDFRKADVASDVEYNLEALPEQR